MSKLIDFICSKRCTFLCISFVISILISGCASLSQNTSSKIESSARPAWLLNPEKQGYQSVVAAAPRQDRGGHDAQYRVAVMKAYQELAQIQRVQVTSTNLILLEDRGGKVTRNLDVETQLQSRVALGVGDARVIEEWVDPENGDLYIWLVIPK